MSSDTTKIWIWLKSKFKIHIPEEEIYKVVFDDKLIIER